MDKNSIISAIKDREAALDITDPPLSERDQKIMNEMIREINAAGGTKLRGFSDAIDHYAPGAADIVAGYVHQFASHSIRSSLLFHIVGNRTYSCKPAKNCEDILWDLYTQYRASTEFPDNVTSLEFDNAYMRVKPKKLLAEMISLAQNPVDFCWMPLTMRMLASLKIPVIGELLEHYFDHPEVIRAGLEASCTPDLYGEEELQRKLRRRADTGYYTAIAGLKYYPSPRIASKLRQLESQLENEMKDKLSVCQSRNEKTELKDDYSGRLDTIRKSISCIEKALSALEGDSHT